MWKKKKVEERSQEGEEGEEEGGGCDLVGKSKGCGFRERIKTNVIKNPFNNDSNSNKLSSLPSFRSFCCSGSFVQLLLSLVDDDGGLEISKLLVGGLLDPALEDTRVLEVLILVDDGGVLPHIVLKLGVGDVDDGEGLDVAVSAVSEALDLSA